MLYECWRRVARAVPSKIALRDLSSGRQWTFSELAVEAERGGACTGRVAFPQGVCANFILHVLRAWRCGQVVCPLEQDQLPPEIAPGLSSKIVHLKMTSATTGDPRLIAFTASQLTADAQNIVATMGLRPEWPNLGVISLAHSYGFSNLVLPLLLHGIPLVLAGAPLPELLRRGAATEPEVTLAAVPAMWRAWVDAGAVPANVRLAISAGAPLPLSLEQLIYSRQGLKVHNFYGSSECGGIAYDATDIPRTDASCAGTSMRGVVLSLGANGCLQVRSGAVGETYWPHSSPSLGNGVFQTSDLGEILAGSVHLRGRLSDQINIAARKVSPEVIEKPLAMHPGVLDCLVFGTPTVDDQRTEIIVACVVVRPGITGDTLRRFLLEKLPAWQVPREWWLVDSLAPNERGKLSRAEWRRRFVELTTASENIP